jgi:uncharacterized membrane protein
MSDENTPQETTAPTSEVASTTPSGAEGANDEVLIGLVTDGAHALIVAQFPSLDDAEAAYEELIEMERTTSLRIDGVVVASRDADGKVHLGKVTDHSTRTGLKWGVIGGAVLGIIFPPSIIASAATLGAVGAAFGKMRNAMHRSGVSEELAGVLQPGTSGIIAIVEDTAVVEIRRALDKADSIVTKAIDKQLAEQIQREADLAKESLSDG